MDPDLVEALDKQGHVIGNVYPTIDFSYQVSCKCGWRSAKGVYLNGDGDQFVDGCNRVWYEAHGGPYLEAELAKFKEELRRIGDRRQSEQGRR